MTTSTRIRYFGWSALSLETPDGALFFDPFFRPYCGASWFGLRDFANARYICVTQGHEEHFLDVPAIAKAAGAVGHRRARRLHLPAPPPWLAGAQLRSIDPRGGEILSLPRSAGSTATSTSGRR